MPLRAGRALVVGAGNAGLHLIAEMRRGPAGHEVLQPVGFLDDDPRLPGHMIEGVKVLGSVADLPRVIREQRAEIVIVSDPDLPAKVVRDIARVCAEAAVRIKTLPGLSDLHHGRTALSQMRDVRLEDLLGREPVHLHLTEVAEFLHGQRVLVTGAGGSIGSELARQVAGFGPASLVLLDHAENGLYYVHNELLAQYPALAAPRRGRRRPRSRGARAGPRPLPADRGVPRRRAQARAAAREQPARGACSTTWSGRATCWTRPSATA